MKPALRLASAMIFLGGVLFILSTRANASFCTSDPECGAGQECCPNGQCYPQSFLNGADVTCGGGPGIGSSSSSSSSGGGSSSSSGGSSSSSSSSGGSSGGHIGDSCNTGDTLKQCGYCLNGSFASNEGACILSHDECIVNSCESDGSCGTTPKSDNTSCQNGNGLCKNGSCTYGCSTNCTAQGQVCDTTNGQCKFCPTGTHFYAGSCVSCVHDNDCGANQICTSLLSCADKTCENSGAPTCGSGQTCVGNACVAQTCANSGVSTDCNGGTCQGGNCIGGSSSSSSSSGGPTSGGQAGDSCTTSVGCLTCQIPAGQTTGTLATNDQNCTLSIQTACQTLQPGACHADGTCHGTNDPDGSACRILVGTCKGGTCVQSCSENCTAKNQVCDGTAGSPTVGTCVPCAAPTPIFEAGSCVECGKNSDCSNGQICNNLFKCTACTDNTQCGNLFCNSGGSCANCTLDKNCGSGTCNLSGGADKGVCSCPTVATSGVTFCANPLCADGCTPPNISGVTISVSGGSSPYKIHDTVTATISATTSNGKPMIVTMSFPDGSSCTNAGSGNTCGGPFTITSSGTFAFSGSATQGNVSVGAYKSIDVPDPLGSRLKVSDVLPIALGGTAQFSAVAVDNANNPIPLPAPIVWSSSGFGSINSNTGLFTAGMVAGTASIHAVSGVLQGDGSVMIGIPSLTVSASASIVHTGQSVGLTAVLNDPSTGKPLSPQPTFSWTATCGSVSGNASATFYAPADACAATITATAAGATASTSVQVVGPPQITIVTPAPNEALRSDPTNGEKLVNVAVTVTTDHPVTTIAVSGGAACSLGGAQTMSSCTSLVSTPIYSKKTVVVTANDTIGGISVDATPVSVSYEVFGPPTAAMSMSASAGSIAGRANVFKKGTKVTVTVTGDDSANQGIATPTTAAGIQTIWINDETTNGDSSSCWNQGTCAAAFSDVGDYSFSGLVINDAGVYAHPLAGVGFSIRGGTTYRWITPVPDPSGVPPSFLLGGTTKAIDLVVQPDLSGAGTSVKTIEFFSNGKSLGQGSNNFKGSLGFWGITWPLPTTVGINNLTAVITNDINMTTEVPPVTSIEMISTPLVTLSATSPAVNAAFKVNAPIILTAVPSRPVPTVELWVSSTPALLINKAGQSASPYSITWSTSVPGSYWLYARTQDPDNKVWVTSNRPCPSP
jgi:hypothetical protein